MRKILLISCSLIFLNNYISAQISFEKLDKLTTTANFYAVQIADMNGDSLNDVIAATSYLWDSTDEDAKIYIYHQDTLGNLNKAIELNYPKQYPGLKSLAIGDINNDNFNDIIIAYDDSIGIYNQLSIDNFDDIETFYCSNGVYQVICQDINNDTLIDIVANSNTYTNIYYQTETGLEEYTVLGPKSHTLTFLELEDFNKNGFLDAIYHFNYPRVDTNLLILMNNQDLGFQTDSLVLTYFENEEYKYLDDIAAGDFNNDGFQDVLGLNTFTDSIYLWTNSETGFQRQNKVETYEYSDRIETLDLDCDCLNEVLIVGGFTISVHKSDNINEYNTFPVSGQYSSPTNYYNQYAIGDLNNDDKLDIAIAYLDGIVIIENTSKPIIFNSIDSIYRVDTVIYDQYITENKVYQTYVIDTLTDAIVYQTDSLNIITNFKDGNITIDTVFIRETEFCNHPYLDTLVSNQIEQYFSTTSYDTIVFYSSYDTVSTVNIEHYMVSKELQIFPNPNSGYLYISFPLSKNFSNCLIEIISLNGNVKLVKNEIIGDNNKISLNINDLKKGIYLMKFDFGETTIIKKLIKN